MHDIGNVQTAYSKKLEIFEGVKLRRLLVPLILRMCVGAQVKHSFARTTICIVYKGTQLQTLPLPPFPFICHAMIRHICRAFAPMDQRLSDKDSKDLVFKSSLFVS
jgi:hypothetical protein